ncbi:MAG: hypothetical protein JXB30_06315 [Anaerolineae bacterium]|nr:hypothetical protein [Anaerolineae bacterium]
MDIPKLDEFLAFPIEKVRPIVPPSLIFAAGGTRRSAALSGVSPDDYPMWARQRMLETYQMFYAYGVRHIIAPMTHPRMFKEKGYFGDNFVSWAEEGLAGSETLEHYRKAHWKAHMIVAVSNTAKDPRIQRLQALAETLDQVTLEADIHLWYFVVPDYDDYWSWIAERLAAVEKPTRSHTIQALYGADIPPTDLLISFGKPTVSPDVLPPFLWNLVHTYWTQQPSYLLEDEVWRRILYDYAYERSTYRTDKTGREKSALKLPAFWKYGPTIGVGIRVGPYWYPEPFSLPQDDNINK